jgi:uncharacterized protein (TIRG00374 family)
VSVGTGPAGGEKVGRLPADETPESQVLEPAPSDPRPEPRSRWRILFKKVSPYARVAFALLAIGLVIWVLSDHSAELAQASAYLTHIRWEWLVLAVVLEFLSIVSYAFVQQELLSAGGIKAPLGWLTSVTLANLAITNSLPTGSIVSTIFTYRQYRNRGSDEILAGWAILALLVVTSVTLAILAASGVAIAGSESSNLDLVGVTLGVLFVTLVVAALFVQRRILLYLLLWSVSVLQSVWPRVARKPDQVVKSLIKRLEAVRATPLEIFAALVWGFMNWILDCSCLVFSFFALGVDVPWRGLLLAYGAGQLAANLPITPGGLGVVEGSITVALVAYGGDESSTVAAVFLYRIISFWGELPVGWFAWAWLARRRRRERALHHHAILSRPADSKEVIAP